MKNNTSLYNNLRQAVYEERNRLEMMLGYRRELLILMSEEGKQELMATPNIHSVVGTTGRPEFYGAPIIVSDIPRQFMIVVPTASMGHGGGKPVFE